AAARGERAASRVDGCTGVAVSGHTVAGRGLLRSFVLRQLASRFALLFDTRVPRQPLSEVRTPKGLQALGVRRGKATHASAVRCAQLVDGLYQRPLGWSLEAAASQLGLSERSIERYVKACADFITDQSGRPRIEIVRQGGRRMLHLAQRAPDRESTLFQVAALRLARALIWLASRPGLVHTLAAAC